MTIQSHTPLNARSLKQDFPILEPSDAGKPFIYLDSAATSQKPQVVIDALCHYYAHSNANVHRGVYRLAEEATAAYEGARRKVADFVRASPEETIFVRNATEAINLVASTWGRQNVQAGDVILLTRLEHHSNLVPWQLLAHAVGADLAFIDLQSDGSIDLESMERHLRGGRVKLVACTYVSNVLGTILPVTEMIRQAHTYGAVVLVDGAQAVPHMPIDVRELDVDFLAFTGHKMLGPMGVGVLYGRRALLEAMTPFLGGGDMIRRVGWTSSTWNDLPWKFEAGTPNVGDAVALGTAVDYLSAVGMEAIAEHGRILSRYAMSLLREIPGVRVYGPQERGPLVAFTLDTMHPHDLASLLDEEGIAVRAGHHCAQPLHSLLGIPATTRASFHLYNDGDDVDALVAGIHHSMRMFAA